MIKDKNQTLNMYEKWFQIQSETDAESKSIYKLIVKNYDSVLNALKVCFFKYYAHAYE